MFQRHKGTGKVEMRVRVIKRIDTGDKEGLLLVAQANKGLLEAWTFIPTRDLKYLNKQREGVLVYGRWKGPHSQALWAGWLAKVLKSASP